MVGLGLAELDPPGGWSQRWFVLEGGGVWLVSVSRSSTLQAGGAREGLFWRAELRDAAGFYKSPTGERSLGPGCPRAPSRSAFTLVELLVVVSIIALLTAILTPMVQRAVWQRRRSQAHTEVNALAISLQSYFAVYNSWGELPERGEFTREVMDVLAGENRRGQVFMEFPQEAWDDPPFRAPELEPGEPREPYEFAVDYNYDNTVTGPDGPVRRRVAVWVEDPDGDYITSWGQRNDNQ